MHELRWTLLLLGVLFIAVLALWEQRRSRSRPGVEPRSGERPQAAPAPGAAHESALALPEVHAREPAAAAELPVLTVAPDSPLAVHFDSEFDRAPDAGPEADITPWRGRREPTLSDDAFGETREDESLPRLAGAPESLRVPDLPVTEWADEAHGEHGRDSHAPVDADVGDVDIEPGAEAASREEHLSEPEPVHRTAPPVAAALPAEPIVDWPPEEERQILALRIVSAGPERFAGRALRQALAGEGFIHGKFAIFHKPSGDRRACLSAASLTRPGTFDPATMDLQRFGGLSLFAVLPGPRTPADTLEELLSSARRLNERLQGALQDERGGPLTPARIAQLRESVAPEDPA